LVRPKRLKFLIAPYNIIIIFFIVKLTNATVMVLRQRMVVALSFLSSILLVLPSAFWATFCKTVPLCYRTVVLSCLCCLSVTLVYCGQTVGWIRMPLGTKVGLGPGDCVLDRNPAPPRGHSSDPSHFGPCLFWPNGRLFQQLLRYLVRINLS